MTYEIRIKETEKMRVVYTNYQGKLENPKELFPKLASKNFPKLFKSVKGKAIGAPFFNYLDFEKDSKLAKLDICLPSFEKPSSSEVLVKDLASIKVLSTIHTGPYEELIKAYKAIEDYALENKIKIQLPFREIFIKGPGRFLKGNPEKYITEIQFTIGED